VSRPTRGRARLSPVFIYGAITLYGRHFQTVLLTVELSHRTPTPQATVVTWFRLVPVRSPLLGESLLLSFPEGTEMFQFPSFAPPKR
jgi:hypothetical protein